MTLKETYKDLFDYDTFVQVKIIIEFAAQKFLCGCENTSFMYCKIRLIYFNVPRRYTLF